MSIIDDLANANRKIEILTLALEAIIKFDPEDAVSRKIKHQLKDAELIASNCRECYEAQKPDAKFPERVLGFCPKHYELIRKARKEVEKEAARIQRIAPMNVAMAALRLTNTDYTDITTSEEK